MVITYASFMVGDDKYNEFSDKQLTNSEKLMKTVSQYLKEEWLDQGHLPKSFKKTILSQDCLLPQNALIQALN